MDGKKTNKSFKGLIIPQTLYILGMGTQLKLMQQVIPNF